MAGGAGSSVAPVTATREFDIVLYGATGFVGKLTAEYLAGAGGNARIALAGRSPDRLQAIRDTLGESAQSWDVLTADASSPSTLDAMAERHAGRHHHRRPLQPVRSAAGRRVRGRGHRLRRPDRRAAVRPRQHRPVSQAGSETPARASCMRVDSTPSLRISPCTRCYRRAREDGSGELIGTDFVVRAFSGGFSGGTIASGVEVLDCRLQ